jgi:2,3,4,5-tetrahydropyridine-2,6-dicarboxylate N-succinyltransferase
MDQNLEAQIVALEERLAAEPQAVRKKPGRIVDEVLAALDTGEIRVCEPQGDEWVVHAWVKRAILLSFARYQNEAIGDQERGPLWYDKMPLKRNFAKLGARCVPPGVARYGSFLGRGTILMPARWSTPGRRSAHARRSARACT